jgi:HSP20 family protein
MADTKAQPTETKKETAQSTLTPRERDRGTFRRWEPGVGAVSSPFDLFDRVSNEMDRLWDRVSRDFGFPRRSWLSRGPWSGGGGETIWQPRIEAFQKGDRFIIRAELPGLKKDDVDVELTDETLTIRGERHDEHQEEREGYYHSEREYGSFYRTIPLPEGVITESAQATFRDGVLEVSMPAAPSEANRGRKLEIKEGAHQEQKK